jgi:hypothetical protein
MLLLSNEPSHLFLLEVDVQLIVERIGKTTPYIVCPVVSVRNNSLAVAGNSERRNWKRGKM